MSNFFFSNEKYNAIYVENTVSGTWFTTQKPKNRKNWETKYVETNNIVYMELYSGAKMVNEKDLKTKYLR
jgi:hypothetical protein